MPGPAWGEDSPADEAVIAANVSTMLAQIVAASPERQVPSLSLAHGWHSATYQGIRSMPRPHYLDQFRGCADPDLVDYEVVLTDRVTGRVVAQGVPAARVAGELATFEAALLSATSRLDAVIPAGRAPSDRAQLQAAVELAAVVHGEWVRIHPYANGNGRTARTWANWVATRYGLPPFVRIKPRPDGLLYGQVARASMGLPPDFTGDHSLTISLFLDLLRQHP